MIIRQASRDELKLSNVEERDRRIERSIGIRNELEIDHQLIRVLACDAIELQAKHAGRIEHTAAWLERNIGSGGEICSDSDHKRVAVERGAEVLMNVEQSRGPVDVADVLQDRIAEHDHQRLREISIGQS